MLFLVLCLLFLSLCGCSSPPTCDNTLTSEPCLRILFIGNSYTYVNDLPNLFTGLAFSGGHPVETAMSAEGGWTFADHLNSTQTIQTITAHTVLDNPGQWNLR
jgi:hypothetical protein